MSNLQSRHESRGRFRRLPNLSRLSSRTRKVRRIYRRKEEDIQSLESLNTSYRDYRRQDEETVHPLLSELDEQLIGAKYFTEQDVCWGYDNEQIKDKDKWEMAKTNRILFEPMVIFSSSYYSPTTSQTNMDGIFLDQRNERRIDIDNDPETKEQNTEYTRSVPRRSRDNDLFTEPEGYTSWVTRTEYEGLPNPENQLLANPMKLYGIDKWPTVNPSYDDRSKILSRIWKH